MVMLRSNPKKKNKNITNEYIKDNKGKKLKPEKGFTINTKKGLVFSNNFLTSC